MKLTITQLIDRFTGKDMARTIFAYYPEKKNPFRIIQMQNYAKLQEVKFTKETAKYLYEFLGRYIYDNLE